MPSLGLYDWIVCRRPNNVTIFATQRYSTIIVICSNYSNNKMLFSIKRHKNNSKKTFELKKNNYGKIFSRATFDV